MSTMTMILTGNAINMSTVTILTAEVCRKRRQEKTAKLKSDSA